MRASQQQINRLYDAISRNFGESDHGGDILDSIRDLVGRWNFSYYDELSSAEIEQAIQGLGG